MGHHASVMTCESLRPALLQESRHMMRSIIRWATSCNMEQRQRQKNLLGQRRNRHLCAQSGSTEFKSAREAMASPLAKRLFGIDGVSSVFFGGDFVTVTKSDEYSWSVLKPDIFAAIMDHYTSGAFRHYTSDASFLESLRPSWTIPPQV